jgi:hypothetical protein
MWDELGIAPSDDPKAIRRAYAARLKALDPDRDPAGFVRLRQALEWALGRAPPAVRSRPRGNAQTLPQPDGPEDAPPPVTLAPDLPRSAPPLASPQPILAHADVERQRAEIAPGFNRTISTAERIAPLTTEDEARDRELLAALERALRWRRGGEAIALYDHACANGALALDDARDMLWRVFEVAGTDPKLDGPAFRGLLRTHGWDTLDVHSTADRELRAKVGLRLAAEDWYDARLKAADNRCVERYVARLLFKRAGWLVIRAKAATVRAMLAAYWQHAALLGDRIDAAWVARLERRLRQREIAGLTLWCVVLLSFLVAAARELSSLVTAPFDNMPDSILGVAVLVIVLLALLLAAKGRRLYRLAVPPDVQASLRARWSAALRPWRSRLQSRR